MSETSVAQQGYITEERDDGTVWFRVGEEFANTVAIAKKISGYTEVADAWHVALFDPFTNEATWAITHGRELAVRLCALHARTAARAVAS